MAVNTAAYTTLKGELDKQGVTLVAVSKVQSVADMQQLYDLGQRDFGENYVQELVEKQALLPPDIKWHFIGHFQSNKVKQIASFVHLVQGVDSYKLLVEISKQGKKLGKVIHCLLQVHIAEEETKFGLNEHELDEIFTNVANTDELLSHVYIDGLMGMASFSNDVEKVKHEMKFLKSLFDKYSRISTDNCHLTILSMGMSGDYQSAIEEGSNMVRIGSLLFGARTKQ